MENTKKNEAIEELFDWMESILFSLFIVSLFFTFILRPCIVNGSSMFPTLNDKDRLVMSNWFYEPENKDIVVVKTDNIEDTNAIIKRVIATQGQEINIDFDEGKVYVDDVEQYEPYINEITKNDFIAYGQAAFEYPVTVPENCVFVMGDNRNNSTDSRSTLVGFVSEDDIIGHAIFRIFPFDLFGKIE